MTENIQVNDLVRSFGDHHVLRGLNLTTKEGELVALYGPSGSGKTTLLNLIGALDHPTSGEINVLGRDIINLSEGKRVALRREQIAFIFQSATLISTYSAAENIELALRLLPRVNYFERRRRIKATLRAVGLTPWADHMPEELSGGQRQRIAIARALAMQSALILADEPTSGLDTQNARQMLSLFRGIAHSEGTTFLIVTHDPMLGEYMDNAYDLSDGQLVSRQNSKKYDKEKTQ